MINKWQLHTTTAGFFFEVIKAVYIHDDMVGTDFEQ